MAQEVRKPRRQPRPHPSEVVYDNTTEPLTIATVISGSSIPYEAGSEITLAGRFRFVRGFSFYYLCPFDGVTAILRFYLNDGPNGAPGTLFFESPSFAVVTLPSTPGVQTLLVNHFVPDTFIWTLTSYGPSEDSFALFGSYPPTVGFSPPVVWYKELFTGQQSWQKGDHENPPLAAQARVAATLAHSVD